MKPHRRLRTPLSQARGLGSAGDGVGHWVWQRLTALAMIPLTVWFMTSLLLTTRTSDVTAVQNWLAAPGNAIFSALLLGALFFHARLGLQVIIEDYIHHSALKIVTLVLTYLVYALAAVATIFAIGHLHFTS